MSLPELSSWSINFQVYCQNCNFCEYVKFGAIMWKMDILSITALHLSA